MIDLLLIGFDKLCNIEGPQLLSLKLLVINVFRNFGPKTCFVNNILKVRCNITWLRKRNCIDSDILN